jgi:microcystin-dependent protein
VPATTDDAGGGQPHNNMQPYLTLNCIIALQGVFPSRNSAESTADADATAASADPLLGSIAWVPYNFAPRGWATCDGQLLPISSNTALFSLIGTIYGGDGRTTFALPDARGRTFIHAGTGPGLTPRTLGDISGTESETLTVQQMPVHDHSITAPLILWSNSGSRYLTG